MGKSRIKQDLVVTGASSVSGDSSVGGNHTVTGNQTVTGTHGVTSNQTVGGTSTVTGAASVGGALAVGTTGAADTKAILDLQSTTKGALFPRMTTSQRDAITSPTTGLVVFNSTTNKMNVYNGSSWVDVGSGGGGSKNYLGTVNNVNANGDFELGTTGWSLGNVSLSSTKLPTGTPTFGSGASVNLSIAAVTSGTLAGTTSLSYASSSATTAGDFLASSAITIDKEDQAKVIAFKLYYSATVNPSNANWSGTNSNSFGIAFWDVANSSFIIPSGCFNFTQSSGVGIVQGTFQTPSNMTQFRVCLFNANATSGAITLLLKDFYVGPQVMAFGPAMSDWIAYTPTTSNLGTVSNVNFFYRRVGDSVEISGRLVIGTPVAATATISLPTGLSIDFTKQISSGFQMYGTLISTGRTTTLGVGSSSAVSSTAFGCFDEAFATQSGTGLGAAGSLITLFAKAPISGWSSNTVQSTDFDGRIIAAKYNTSSQTVTTTATVLNATTKEIDTAGAYSSGVFTCPVSGIYEVSSSAQGGATSAGSTNQTGMYLSVQKNGSTISNFAQYIFSVSSVNVSPMASGSTLVQCNAGDTLSVVTYHDANVTNYSLIGTASSVWVSFKRLQGPSVVAASETVAARYNTSSQALGNGTFDVAKFSVKDYDTHSCYSTTSGLFTVPVAGYYRIELQASVGSRASATYDFTTRITKNSSVALANQNNFNSTASITQIYNNMISTTAYFVPGDTINATVRAGYSGASLTGTSYDNYLCITKVGQ
jgi:hypothetical protein